MKQGHANKSWNTCSSEYLLLQRLLRPKKRLLVHFYTLNHIHNGKHCGLRVTFLEKCAYL